MNGNIILKFMGKEIIFGEWGSTLTYDTFSLRRSPVPPMKGTYIEWILDYRAAGLYLFRNFQGQGEASGLYSLRHVYDRMYPNVSYRIEQKREAQDHMDEFIVKFNSLKAFI